MPSLLLLLRAVLLAPAVFGAGLEDDALHEQEQPLVDPVRADLRQLSQREHLQHQECHWVQKMVQDQLDQ